MLSIATSFNPHSRIKSGLWDDASKTQDNSYYLAFDSALILESDLSFMEQPGTGLARGGVLWKLENSCLGRGELSTDDMLIELWLNSKSSHTKRAYRTEWGKFRQSLVSFSALRNIRIKEVQSYLEKLKEQGLSPNSRRRAQSALKSLFSFGYRVGCLPFNLGPFLAKINALEKLSSRILDEPSVHRLLTVAEQRGNKRNALLIRLLYAGGLRVSELCELRWSDLTPRGASGQMSVFGKGGKTRVILLSESTWQELEKFKPKNVDPLSSVFKSQKEPYLKLDPSAVFRIVKTLAHQAGLPQGVSPHWLRHCHATHALDRGAPLYLVQSTLGHASISTTGQYLHARPEDSSARYLGI